MFRLVCLILNRSVTQWEGSVHHDEQVITITLWRFHICLANHAQFSRFLETLTAVRYLRWDPDAAYQARILGLALLYPTIRAGYLGKLH